ncbi:hypothetical protein MiSe_52830 [Microseira wollei NIES-4236]|uniref:Uncharacterized protein n=1 Tax=Microseira wollei NIES-4236 TaxID=2530354 RepID=A0AAV3XDQ1_9CYAN|nr:hypothetical protein MiSe_52830 [Microseira wollei NIES-4236]
MNNSNYFNTNKALLLFCKKNCWFIIDRFTDEDDAVHYLRELNIFLKQSKSYLKVLNIKNPSTWNK